MAFHYNIAVIYLRSAIITKDLPIDGETKVGTQLFLENKFTDILEPGADGMGIDKHTLIHKIKIAGCIPTKIFLK